MKTLERKTIVVVAFVVVLTGLVIYRVHPFSRPVQPEPQTNLPSAAASPTPTLSLGSPASPPPSPTPTNADPALDDDESSQSWTVADEQKFVLDAGAVQFAILAGNLSPFRYSIKSTQPVNVLVVLEEQIHEIRMQQMAGVAVDLSQLFKDVAFQDSLPCFSAKVLESQTNCRILDNTLAAILILDTRDPGKLPLKAAGAILGMREPLKNALAQNRVSITLYEWGDHQMQVGPWVSVEAPGK